MTALPRRKFNFSDFDFALTNLCDSNDLFPGVEGRERRGLVNSNDANFPFCGLLS